MSTYNDFSSLYEDLRTKQKLPTLHVHIRRLRTMAIKTFKIFNCIAPIVLRNLLQKRGNLYNLRYSRFEPVSLVRVLSRVLPLCFGTLSQKLFRKCSNFNQFKQLILSWNGKECKCVACNWVIEYHSTGSSCVHLVTCVFCIFSSFVESVVQYLF